MFPYSLKIVFFRSYFHYLHEPNNNNDKRNHKDP